MKAQDYAKALYQIDPKATHARALRAALGRRGHEKLMPQILLEYQKLQLRASRLARYKKITPAMERTRVLLELYRTLVAHSP